MTDGQRMIALLRERGERGAHTSEIRRMGISGNPSQRRIEALDEGYSIDSIRESFVDAAGQKRPGARFVLREEPDVEPASNSGPPPELPAQASPPPEPEPAGGLGAALFVIEAEPEADYRDPDAWGDAAA